MGSYPKISAKRFSMHKSANSHSSASTPTSVSHDGNTDMPFYASHTTAAASDQESQHSPSMVDTSLTDSLQSTRPQNTCKYYATIMSMVLGWFLISNVIILASKHNLSHGAFPFPLCMTLFYNSSTSVTAFLVTRIPYFKPEPVSKEIIYKLILPVGIFTAIEIGCSNWALQLLTVSFGTILKSIGPVWTLTWGVFFGLEILTLPLALAVATITGGVCLAALGVVNFSFFGILLQLTSTCLSGLRWALTNIILSNMHAEKLSPLTTTLYTAPLTAISLIPFVAIFETSKLLVYFRETETHELIRICTILYSIGVLVFFLLVVEFSLVVQTSSLTVSIYAVIKELLTIFGGIMLFNEEMTILNWFGFVVSHLGLGHYLYLRNYATSPASFHNAESPVGYQPLDTGEEEPNHD